MDHSINTILLKKHYTEINKFASTSAFRCFSYTIEEKEEIKQDILLKVYRNIHKFDPSKHKLSSFVYTIANTIIIDYGRKKNASKRINGNKVVYLDKPIDDSINMHDLIGVSDNHFIDANFLMNKIHKVIGNFRNENYKKVFNLFFVEHNKMDSIAEELSIPINTVKTIIFQLRKKLSIELINFKYQ